MQESIEHNNNNEMKDYFSYENNITLVDLIIKSTNELVPLVVKHTNIDSNISETLALIFKFLIKIFNLLPEVFIAEGDYNYQKKQTKNSFLIVVKNWDNFKDNPTEFKLSWDEFMFWWGKIHKKLLDIQKSKHTIFLSMN